MKIAAGVIVVLAVIWGMWHLAVDGWHVEIGSGEHTGYVTAVERNGVVWKTGRAYVKTDTSSSQEDVYCIIADANVYQQLQDASTAKTHVSVYYTSWLIPGARNCHGEDSVIYAVKPAK